ncbi:type II secretion system F family protein [Paucibacter sp. PLA-PC-4]|uniref:type II secretion system F family protein n=1 Tax=Paucibacter sp. PLA-PC-4 TaxID=2993655 RepID=UPI00224991C6|nr:type II secretion system F family protein [Paucibacter sp. PLA-PC-4]MCX2861997.1 type II secretion system F family protein [Paucibacter sp. PLA-PC-4]
MPQYQIRIFHPQLGVQSRRIEAPDRQSLAGLAGVAPQHLLEVEELSGGAERPKLGGRGKRFPLQLFSQELAVLLDAGIALLEALTTLREKEANPAVRVALDGVIDAVQQGRPLSAAMQAQPQAFDELVCAIVAANERTGQLSAALAQHARYLAWVESLRSRLIAACVYPAMLLLVGGAVILFLLLFVLPRFAGILDGLGNELPWASRALITFGQTAGSQPLLVLGGLAVILGSGLGLWRHAGLRQRLQASLWTLPGLGPRLRVLALARLYRSMGMLLGSGVPVLAALRIVEGVVALPWRAAVTAAAEQVAQGGRFSDALEDQGLATPVARRMVRVGERSGELPAMLERAAAFHDEEAVRLTELLTRAINPALMLVMGVLIGGIIVLMYLPIFQLVEQVQ